MGLETGTYISDLVITNPPSGDQTSQGDDHLRLIKTVLKNTFPQASKAVYFPTATAKTANFSAVLADQFTTFLVDTTAGIVTATLPTLAAGDAGWECSFIKTNTGLSPLLIKPPSGTVQSGDLSGLTQTRRCIPGAKSRAYWTGSNWFVERAVNAPVGAVLTFDGASLPVGYEWPNGQTLASASTNYPDYNSRKGSGLTSDLRGRLDIGKDDMGGSAAARVTTAVSGIDGVTLGASGGSQILQQHLHAVSISGNTGTESANHTHNFDANIGGGAGYTVGGPSAGNQGTGTTAVENQAHTHAFTVSGNSANAGTGGSQNMPPGIVMNKILVVE